MKAETVKEKIRIVQEIQRLAREVIKDNGGHDIKFITETVHVKKRSRSNHINR